MGLAALAAVQFTPRDQVLEPSARTGLLADLKEIAGGRLMLKEPADTSGTDFNDYRLIWGKLDQVRTKHPDMVLSHGRSPKGAELIAAKWAEA